MKFILNNTTLEIISKPKENRYKKVDNFVINSSNQWTYDANVTCYFVNAKAGDTIVVTPPTPTTDSSGYRFLIAFTSTNVPVNGTVGPFVNGTDGRIRSNIESTFTVSEDCYLYVLETQSTTNWKPKSIIINGSVLDEDGWL